MRIACTSFNRRAVLAGAAALVSSPTRAGKQTQIVMMDAVQLSAAIHAREISCVEVMRAYLAQIDRFNPHVNAIVARQDTKQLLAQAAQYDSELALGESRGWMHGFPHAIKDLEN